MNEVKDYQYYELREPRCITIANTLLAEGYPAKHDMLEPRLGQLIALDNILKNASEASYDIIQGEVFTAMQAHIGKQREDLEQTSKEACQLRDKFAEKVLMQLLRGVEYKLSDADCEVLAQKSYVVADKMMKQRLLP